MSAAEGLSRARANRETETRLQQEKTGHAGRWRGGAALRGWFNNEF